MLYKFKSPAGADVIMTQGPAQHILTVIGKATTGPGIITPEQIPAAISALRAEVARQENERAQGRASEAPAQAGQEPEHGEFVLFSQRVAPLIHLLELSLAENHGVVWGV